VAQPWIAMEVFSPLPDELTPASDTSNTRSVISELCLKPPVNIFRVCVLLEEKLNGHSLLMLHPAAKNLSIQRYEHFEGSLLSLGQGPDASSSVRKLHEIGCVAVHEALPGSRWIWLRPLLLDHPI
jgi:hypothetical protein